MKRRTNILARLRRWKTGAARYVVGSFAVAYLAAGVAPCAMAANRATESVDAAAREHVGAAHEDHAVHEPRADAHAQRGHETHGGTAVAHESAPAPADDRSEHCPHCFSAAEVAHGDDRSSCLAFDDLTNSAASHAKDAPQPLAPSFAAAAFTLPPPLASPRPAPLRAAGIPPVPLNVRHCVFLI